MSKWISADYLLGRMSLRRDGVLTEHDIVTAPYAEFKWIPVTERMPEEDGRYLCNTRSVAFKGCFYRDILKYDRGGFLEPEGYIYTDAVTHWMELPEGPTEERR